MTFCGCGCGEEIIPQFHHKYYGIPKYINNHGRKGITHPLYGKPISKEHTNKISKENNWNWKGGISPLNHKIRNSFKYSKWRIQILGRDNFTCQKCGKRGSWLEVHHIKSFAIILRNNNINIKEDAINCNELWNLDNGITLCKECHFKINNCLEFD